MCKFVSGFTKNRVEARLLFLIIAKILRYKWFSSENC